MIYLITCTSFYSNWGDVAIDVATALYLDKRKLPYAIINEFSTPIDIHESDTILIRGGGYLGLYNGWPEKFIKSWLFTKAYNKILLPSSLYFDVDTSTVDDIRDLNLTICARDYCSYETYSQYFVNSRVWYVPDMALLLPRVDLAQPTTEYGVIARGTERKHNLSEFPYHQDTYVNRYDWKFADIPYMFHYLYQFLQNISQYEYIITDSLHCCLFSYLCKRKCFAFNNKYGKVFNTLSDYQLPNIYMVNKLTDITPIKFNNAVGNIDYSALSEILKKD